MAHFAELDKDNVVLRVLVIDDSKTQDENGIEHEELGVAYCKSLFGEDTNWIQASYNRNMRGHFASVNYIYNQELDAFIPPKPHASFILNKEKLGWIAPKPEPKFDVETEQCYWSDEVNDFVVEKRINGATNV